MNKIYHVFNIYYDYYEEKVFVHYGTFLNKSRAELVRTFLAEYITKIVSVSEYEAYIDKRWIVQEDIIH
jgi:hypothetical protein